jgi:putative tryptophan/tyrosine transport system substrate-binding protein
MLLSLGDCMKRREFLGVVSGAAAWPLAARAQQAERVRRIGVLMATSEHDDTGQDRLAVFRQTLGELGWIEGRNLKFEVRWTAGDPVLVRDYTAELLALAPELIFAQGTPNTAALKKATQSLPIVFAVVNDPVAQGFVASMAHPGGNVTGFSFLEYSMVGKSLELLKQVSPGVVRVAAMFNPETYPYYAIHLRSFETVAHAISIELNGAPIHSPAEVDETFAKLGQQPGSAVLVLPDPYTTVHRRAIVEAAARSRVPATYSFRNQIKEGALMSYGADTRDIFRRAAVYIDRILKGTRPADLPVQAPTKFELAFNLKTAAALGLTVPPLLLATADEVVE